MDVNSNTALMQVFTLNRARSGWKTDEEDMLWNEVRKAREEGRALKSVFDIVALKTGRKPNSIRNYYYARAKENPEESARNPAFVPFSEQEIWDLLETVLTEQAKGVSVRACTLKMGKGDTSAMLRYQNKYRSLIKTNAALVKQVISSLQDRNILCFNPYQDGRSSVRRAGRPCKPKDIATENDNASMIQGIINLLKIVSEVEDVNRRIQRLELIIEGLEVGRRMNSISE